MIQFSLPRQHHFSILFIAIILLSLASCTAPRSIISSGKVTPKGAFKAGMNSSFNFATAPLAELDNITRAAVDAIDTKQDSIIYNPAVAALTSGLMIYALDPVSPSADVYLRYGLADRVDVGYKYASGAHVLDAMYQVMGTIGTPDEPQGGGWYGSIGLQYSGQSGNLPSKVGLDKLSSIFRFDLSRKDILVPLVFSYSFGPEETYGNVSFGVVYGHSSVRYGFNPSKTLVRYTGNTAEKIPAFNKKESFSAFGGFVNGKIGYKYVYFVPALSIYHQNYGSYNLFGLQQNRYKGFTFIPSIGVQFNLGRKN